MPAYRNERWNVPEPETLRSAQGDRKKSVILSEAKNLSSAQSASEHSLTLDTAIVTIRLEAVNGNEAEYTQTIAFPAYG